MTTKDPAFLFYPNDYIGGTMGMTFEEKGAYMELLMMQFNRGHLSESRIVNVIGVNLWNELQHKFTQDDQGLWFNNRLEQEQTKRKNYSESRRNNRNGESIKKHDSDNNPTNIYIIKDIETGNIKIGASVNPKNRLSTLKYKLNKNLALIAISEDCTLLDEKLLHKHFSKFNIQGDWFDLNEEDVIEHMIKHMNKHMIKHMENENENINKGIVNNKSSKETKVVKGKGKPDEKKPDFIDEIIEVFRQSYEEIRGDIYEVTNKGKERSAAGDLLKLFKQRNPGLDSNATKSNLQTFFKMACDINSTWLYNNMSLPILYSNINNVLTILKNGKSSKSTSKGQSSISDEFKRGLVERMLSSEYSPDMPQGE